MASVSCAGLLKTFSCLGDRCEDTCCKGWSMQVDDATVELYRREAPELLGSVEPAEETPQIMRKDPKTGYCVRFEDGLCGIHKQRGDRFLGNACHFYPRITRTLGSKVLMTASMSCPEIARIALYREPSNGSFDLDVERLPHGMKDYLPAGMAEADALAVHQAFLDAALDEGASAETVFMRISSAARSMEMIGQEGWPVMAAFYLSNADAMLLPPETDPADSFNLLHALCGIIVATHKPMPDRLRTTLEAMEKALSVRLDWANVLIDADKASLEAYAGLKREWESRHAAAMAPVLRRWLMMQLSVALFPFSGLGSTLSQRITIIGVRLAMVKLAIMCNLGLYKNVSAEETVVRVVQSLSRILDHLGDPAFSLSIFTETGWITEPRMRGLLQG